MNGTTVKGVGLLAVAAKVIETSVKRRAVIFEFMFFCFGVLVFDDANVATPNHPALVKE